MLEWELKDEQEPTHDGRAKRLAGRGRTPKARGGSLEASGWGGVGMGGAQEIFRAVELFCVTP